MDATADKLLQIESGLIGHTSGRESPRNVRRHAQVESTDPGAEAIFYAGD